MKVTVVGSGPSSIHFALTLLNKGYSVEMIDVGYKNEYDILKGYDFGEIKENYSDPIDFFLGKNFETIIPPDSEEIYRFPPTKQYVFKKPKNFVYSTKGFEPLFSFAQGGLAEAWTGGSYPFNNSELEDFPFDYDKIEQYYSLVAERIGLCGTKDDLSKIFPFHDNIINAPELDLHSKYLEKNYSLKKSKFDRFILGRSRIALLTKDYKGRKACDMSGKCQWGCSNDSLYVPSLTLNECLKHKNFTYYGGIFVKFFNYKKGKVFELIGEDVNSGKEKSFDIDILALGAGTLSTGKIFLDSIYKNSGKIEVLKGLMDNRQVIAPFVSLSLLTKQYDLNSYQYHLLSAGIITDDPKEYIHTQITTLKTSLVHPVINSLPFDFKSSIFYTRNIRTALGVANINFNDYRRNNNFITIKPIENNNTELYINYVPEPKEKKKIKESLKFLSRNFLRLGAIMPDFQVRIRNMGESVHYAGILPMSKNKKNFFTNENCRSYDFDNLFIIDGSTFPFLSAKNITFTLMANASRIADKEF